MIMKKIVIIFCLLVLIVMVGFQLSSNKNNLNVQEYVKLGNEKGMEGNHLEASKAFKVALDLDPYHIPAYLGLGTAYGNAGLNKEAIEVFNKAFLYF